jgi:CHAD domain-containing protein
VAFRFKLGESLPRATKRIARQQIDEALDQVTGQTRATQEEAVHDARKRLKRIRALLRLVRSSLGRKRYNRENASFREAGRLLAGIRDARVLVNTMGELTSRFGDQIAARVAIPIEEALLDHQKLVGKRLLEQEDVLASVAVALKAARRRIKKWAVDVAGQSTLRAGLKQVYKRSYEAFSVAIAEPSVENFHEWRKRVKDFWHQLQIVQSIWPKVTEELVNQAHTLAGDLGKDHDLGVFRQFLSQDTHPFGGRAAVETLLPLIDGWRAELRQAAHLLGRSIYRDKPKVFINRLRR